jgi:hypothetical protein
MMELENARGDFLYFRMDYIYSHAERITPENEGELKMRSIRMMTDLRVIRAAADDSEEE